MATTQSRPPPLQPPPPSPPPSRRRPPTPQLPPGSPTTSHSFAPSSRSPASPDPATSLLLTLAPEVAFFCCYWDDFTSSSTSCWSSTPSASSSTCSTFTTTSSWSPFGSSSLWHTFLREEFMNQLPTFFPTLFGAFSNQSLDVQKEWSNEKQKENINNALWFNQATPQVASPQVREEHPLHVVRASQGGWRV